MLSLCRQTDGWMDRRTMVKQYAPDLYGGIKREKFTKVFSIPSKRKIFILTQHNFSSANVLNSDMSKILSFGKELSKQEYCKLVQIEGIFRQLTDLLQQDKIFRLASLKSLEDRNISVNKIFKLILAKME